MGIEKLKQRLHCLRLYVCMCGLAISLNVGGKCGANHVTPSARSSKLHVLPTRHAHSHIHVTRRTTIGITQFRSAFLDVNRGLMALCLSSRSAHGCIICSSLALFVLPIETTHKNRRNSHFITCANNCYVYFIFFFFSSSFFSLIFCV